MSDVNKDSKVEHPQGICTPDGEYVDLVKIGDNHYLPVTIVDPSGDQQGDSVNPLVVNVDDILSGTQTNDVKVTLDGEDVGIDTINQAVSAYSADISTTAQEISFSGGDITIPANTKAIIIQNDDDANQIYIGGSNVTSAGANGFALRSQESTTAFNNLGSSFSVYVVGSAAGTQLRILYL